jgi:hypothetical protein
MAPAKFDFVHVPETVVAPVEIGVFKAGASVHIDPGPVEVKPVAVNDGWALM